MKNKFCPSCGQQITEEGTFCNNCGYNLTQTAQSDNANQTNNYNQNNNSGMVNPINNATVVAGPSYTNGMAITGFVLGIVSLLCCCYTSFIGIIGLIFSIIGLKNANEHSGDGKGLAITGIVLNSISVALLIVALILMFIGYAAY